MALKQQLALLYIRTKFSILSFRSKRKAAAAAFDLFCTPQHRNEKPLPQLFLTAEQLQFEFKGYRISGYAWHRERAEKVLILHGFESSVVNFEGFVAPLLQKGYGVLAIDAPAHGRSSGKMINVLLYRDFINHVCQTFGPIHRFVAHSLGGLSLSLALEAWPHNAAYRTALIAPATETRTAIEYYFRYLQLDNSLRQPFDEVIKEKGGHPPEWFSIARAAHNIHGPVLWIHDHEDDMTPISDVEPIRAAAHPSFTFHFTKGLGHRRIYRDAAVVHMVTDFL